MPESALENLARIGQLKAEARNDAECTRMLKMAHTRLADARLPRVSLEGRFTAAYNAAHGAALVALRWYGYRSENRFTVFQCLSHTLGWSAARWRVLDAAHQKRNLAEYEGYLDVEESVVAEMCELTAMLLADVEALIGHGGKGQ